MAVSASSLSRVRMTGPLMPFATDFTSRLQQTGYMPLTVANELRVVAHLSRWLDGESLTAADMSVERIEQYLTARRSAGLVSMPSRRALGVLLMALESAGVVAAGEPAAPASRADQLLASYSDYLLQERALAPTTPEAYVRYARRFLAGRTRDALAGLTAGDITRAVLRESQSGGVGATQYFVAGLRSFLRFCFAAELMHDDLSGAVLSATGRRRSTLPRGVSRATVDALLKSCDRQRADGRRDYAVLLVLVRLGLRSSEVAALTLDDIDWRTGQLVVHGKRNRDDLLPLPNDVGRAIAAHLQSRQPQSQHRAVFLRGLAPSGGLGRGGVATVVRRACQRAGVPTIGPHRLRHTLACDMVAAGVPLVEIGQVLRHTGVSSTAIYARVDLGTLRTLAQSWPVGAA